MLLHVCGCGARNGTRLAPPGLRPAPQSLADTTAASTAVVTGVGDTDNTTSLVCFGSAPSLVSLASGCATRGVAEVEVEPPPKAAAEPPVGTGPTAVSAAGRAAGATSVPASPSFHRYLYGGPPVQRPWELVTPPAQPPPPTVVPGEPPTRIEQRVMHVGTCLTLLSNVLDQLHVTLVRQEVQIEAMQPAEHSAAVSVAEELQHYLSLIGFVPGSPGAALGLGPGALAWLAESARGDLLDLMAAAMSVLRWLDGRLCWILVE
ncbi:unnamed protein product [Closterium sp. NIES-64]|nr:unnamed protein product [Closterium sp. NIES-64]